MRYLQITTRLLHEVEGLYDLVWPDVNTVAYENYQLHHDDATLILRGEVNMIPETHPNITFIMLKLQEHHWYDEDSGPHKFMRYV